MQNIKTAMVYGALLASLFGNGWQLKVALKEKQERTLSEQLANKFRWSVGKEDEDLAKLMHNWGKMWALKCFDPYCSATISQIEGIAKVKEMQADLYTKDAPKTSSPR